ncbi:MAG: ArsA family ATPase [Acidobacteria bacterium]|uniref:arsenite-transporting ATPase n=1 Tax=Candidatus Sulfomarinibacter kjeldsenii TaxID=2885994 RepID=A0A8J6Y698_9BACT|nr:ArsA family ATPase [Candidatus Sulfomarinibacter kjeldsenii]
MGILNRLDQLQLLVVTGKGGVGKSTVTAALGAHLANRGRKVLLIEVDPRENLHQLLDTPPSGGEIVEAAANLWIQHIDPRELLDDLVREKLKVGALVRKVLASPVHLHFTEGAPGLKQTAVFGRALRMVEGHGPKELRRPDVVILDAPASGHGIAWMAAPQLVSEVISSGPIGKMAAEIATFLADRERFGSIVVTTAEEMPVQEVLELLDAMSTRLDRRPELVVVNSIYPKAPEAHATDDDATRLWIRRRQVNEAELARLAAEFDGPVAEIPLEPIDAGPALVGVVGEHLTDAFEDG